MSDNVMRYPALTRAFRQTPEPHNTPALNLLSKQFREPSIHSFSSSSSSDDVSRRASQHKPSIEWFRWQLTVALKEDLKPIEERCGKNAREVMEKAVFNQLGRRLSQVEEDDLPAIQRITSNLKTKSDEDALDTWREIFAEQGLGNLALYQSNESAETRARVLNDALRTVIATKLPGYSAAVHEWVKDRVIDLMDLSAHAINPGHYDRLVHCVRTVTAWVQDKFRDTAGSKGPRYRLTDKTETTLLDRHWKAAIAIDQLRELYSKTPGGLSFEQAGPWIFAARKALKPPEHQNDKRIRVEVPKIFAEGLSWFWTKKETIAVILERLDEAGHIKDGEEDFTENAVKKQINDKAAFYENDRKDLTPLKRYINELHQKYGIDVSDINPLDFVHTGKIDTPRKLESVISGTYAP